MSRVSKADRAVAVDALMTIAARRQRGEERWLDDVPFGLRWLCSDAYVEAKGPHYGVTIVAADDYAAAASLLDAGWMP